MFVVDWALRLISEGKNKIFSPTEDLRILNGKLVETESFSRSEHSLS
jgi:hypothetical protein